MLSNGKKFYELYNSIMNFDDRVRFVTVVDKSGNVEFGGQREDIENYLSKEDQQKSLKQVRDAWFVRDQFSENIGAGKYALAEYEKVKRFSFPMNNSYFLYITTEPSIDTNVFVENILNMIEPYN
ncbi:MAG: DUF6659 family protein [Nitrosopumilus sp.]